MPSSRLIIIIPTSDGNYIISMEIPVVNKMGDKASGFSQPFPYPFVERCSDDPRVEKLLNE